MSEESPRMPLWKACLCVAGAVLLLLGSGWLLWWVGGRLRVQPLPAEEPATMGLESLDRLAATTLGHRVGDPSPLDTLKRREEDRKVRSGLPAEVVAVVGSWRDKQQISGANVIAPSRDGRVAAGGDSTTQVTLHVADTFDVLETLPCPDGLRCLAFSADGRLLVGAGVGWLAVWDVENRPARRLHLLRWKLMTALTVGISPDGQWLAAGGGSCTFTKPSPGSEEAEALQSYLKTPYPMSSTPRDEITYGWVFVWRLGNGELTEWLQAENRPGAVTTLAFSSDNSRLATGDSKGELAIWKIGQGPENKAAAERNLRRAQFCLALLGAAFCWLFAFLLVRVVIENYREAGSSSRERDRCPVAGTRPMPRHSRILIGFNGQKDVIENSQEAGSGTRPMPRYARILLWCIGGVAGTSILATVWFGVTGWSSPPDKIAPWRAATPIGGIAAVAFAPEGHIVYACGSKEGRKYCTLDGRHHFHSGHPRVLRWGLTGSQLTDMPLWHLHHTSAGLGIFIGLSVVGVPALLLALLIPFWGKPGAERLGGLLVMISVGAVSISPLLISLVNDKRLTAEVAWLFWLALVVGVFIGVIPVALTLWFRPTFFWKRTGVAVFGAVTVALVLVLSSGGLMLLTTREPHVTFQVDGDRLQAAAFAPDALTLALALSNDDNSRIEVRDVESGDLLRTEARERRWIELRLLTWDLWEDARRSEAYDRERIEQLTMDSSGICYAATWRMVRCLGRQQRGVKGETALLGNPTEIAFLRDGKTLALLGEVFLRLVDLPKGTEQNLPVRRASGSSTFI